MRFGLFAIPTSPSELKGLDVKRLEIAIGRNTGNLLFTRAVERQVAGDLLNVGTSFDPDRARSELDAILIPAANWVNEREDWGFLADGLNRADLPVVVFGLGAQAGLDKAIPAIPDGTLKFLRSISERSETLSVRGAFTAEVLASYGIQNVRITGCPSLYWHLRRDFAVVKGQRPEQTAISSTRFGLPADAGSEADVQRRLYRLGFEEDLPILYQSEVPELYMALFGRGAPGPPLGGRLAAYYGASDPGPVQDYIARRGLAFLDVDEWLRSMERLDFVVGTRLHATIAALLAGTPAVLLSHDSRTAEMVEFARLPTVRSLGPERLDRRALEVLFAGADVDGFNRAYRTNYETFKSFLAENHVPHNLA